MGFRCPLCAEDFGFDKEEWAKHCKSAHQGIAQEIVDAVKKEIAEGARNTTDDNDGDLNNEEGK